MEQLLKEILKGKKELDKTKDGEWYMCSNQRGIGSKSYVMKRIDLLREQLLELKKEIQSH